MTKIPFGAVLLAAALATGPVVAQQRDYAGATIEILVATNPGTSLDTGARLFAEHIGGFIPGNPTVIVQNLAAAGGNQARNLVYERGPADGTQLVFAATALQDQLLGGPGIQYDHADLTIIAAMEDLPTVSYIRRDALGSDNPADVVRAREVRVGGLRPSSSLDMFPRAAMALFGIDYAYVTGYAGAAGVANAVRSGEVTVGSTAGANFLNVLQPSAGDVVTALWYYPLLDARGVAQRSAVMDAAGVPNLIDVYQQVFGAEPSGAEWEALKFVLDVRSIVSTVLWGSPNMTAEARETLRAAFDAMWADDTFQAAWLQALGEGTTLSTIADAETAYRDLSRFDAAVLDHWRANTQ